MNLFPAVSGMTFWYQRLIFFAARILFIPLAAGVSYEFLKFGAKYYDNKIVKVIIAPGLLFQRLTTKEPDEKQLEVAIQSLKTVLKYDTSTL
jgi:uncharacterized protein YqhQ